MTERARRRFAAAIASVAISLAGQARAQLSGTLVRGQNGLATGTMPPPGLVLTGCAYDYHTSDIVGPNGNTLPTSGSLNTLAVPGLNVSYVRPLKILGGANYGAVLSLWGQGQWGYEFSSGATLWLDKGHHANLSTQILYDIYSSRRGELGPSRTQLRTGNILTLMGGLGYHFLGDGLNIACLTRVQPSRAALMTGHYSIRNGCRSELYYPRSTM